MWHSNHASAMQLMCRLWKSEQSRSLHSRWHVQLVDTRHMMRSAKLQLVGANVQPADNPGKQPHRHVSLVSLSLKGADHSDLQSEM